MMRSRADRAVVADMIDERGFREALGHYPTGVVVVTGRAEDGTPLGMVVGTFSAVSLDPQLVSFMPTSGSATYDMLRQSDTYCVNILAHDQRLVCQTLTTKDRDKFDRVDWTWSDRGLPVIAGAVAHLHCRMTSEIPAGDHLIVVCEVLAVNVVRPVTPLLYFQGGYGGFSSSGMTPHIDSSLITAVRVAEIARPQLERLAARFDAAAEALVQVGEHHQTIGASSYGDTARVDERLGVRVPLLPPLGEAAVAWSPPHAERWLEGVVRGADTSVEDYLAQLAAVRRVGYSLARISKGDEGGYRQVMAAIKEYAAAPLTPARERIVRATLAAGSRYFHDELGDEEEGVDIAAIVVPVFDPIAGGRVNSGLTLRMGGLPQGVSSVIVRGWIDELLAAAREVSEELGGNSRRDYEHYVASGLREMP